LITVATLNGAKNTVPWFITDNGPIREARFKQNPNGTPDGGVHDLFVITGRWMPRVATSPSQNFDLLEIHSPVRAETATSFSAFRRLSSVPDSSRRSPTRRS
jgi:hypothetical protein